MKKNFALPLVAAALVLAACSSEKPGSASPAPSAPPAQTSESGPAPTTGGGDTASIGPCSLISAADLASYGTYKEPVTENAGGARSCRLVREQASASDIGPSVNIGIRDTQGIDTVSDDGTGKTTGNVNGRKAVLAPRPPSGCVLALELTASARVDVLVDDADAEKACKAAEKIADIVEPKLPKG